MLPRDPMLALDAALIEMGRKNRRHKARGNLRRNLIHRPQSRTLSFRLLNQI